MMVDRERPGDAEPQEDWLDSPCSSCGNSPCCRVVPVCRLPVDTRADLLRARALSSHREIELGLYDSGAWVVYWLRECAFLDPGTGKCRVHATPRQPEICRAYSPRDCWYREVYSRGASRRFLRLDLARLDRILPAVRYADSGEIASVPSWETMLDACAAVPLGAPALGVPACPARDLRGWTGEAARVDPCRFLSVPLRRPRKPGDLDLLAFQLGFPGVELSVASGAFSLLLRSDCRRLGTSSCPRVGLPAAAPIENPPDQRRVVRLDLRAFSAVRRGFAWDPERKLLRVPSVAQMRRLLDRGGRQGPEDRPRPRSA